MIESIALNRQGIKTDLVLAFRADSTSALLDISIIKRLWLFSPDKS